MNEWMINKYWGEKNDLKENMRLMSSHQGTRARQGRATVGKMVTVVSNERSDG
jgi:hypothetical protein